jgi:type I restriction enzyme R subunit
MSLNESVIEEATLEWFEGLGYACKNGLLIAPAEPAAERESFGDVVLLSRLRAAIWQLNPLIPDDARDEALRKVLLVGSPSLTQSNRAFHKMLRDGVPVDGI